MIPLLVDSSAWIQCFSKHPDSKFVEIISKAKRKNRLAACGMIYAEVVRGARSNKEYQELSDEFRAMVWLAMEEGHWDLASQIGFQLSQKGIHPPATDLIVASVALAQNCQLLHKDKHFLQIAEYFPLRLA